MTATPNDADRGDTPAKPDIPATTPEPNALTGSGEGSNTRAGDDRGGSASGLEHAATTPTGSPVPPADKDTASPEHRSFDGSAHGATPKTQPAPEPGTGKRMATDPASEKEPDPPGRGAAQAASGHASD